VTTAPAAAEAKSPARDTTRPLPFLKAARGVFDLALEGMVWSRRSVLMAVLMGLPILFGILYRVVLASRLPPRVSGFDLYGVVIAFYYIRNVIPLAGLFYATSLIADEVEGKTLTYLLTRPIRRGSILAGKFAAYLATMLALSIPSTLVTFFLLTTTGGFSGIGRLIPDLFRDLGVVALAILSYGALFTLMGVLLKRPMIPGLLFVYVWELLSNLPGHLPRFTLTAHLRSLITHRPADEGVSELFTQVLPAGECLITLAVVTALFLAAASWIFSRREYVMEQ
jgi:ABC-type transport system involved in multi-copper enzyme maturation permease subunit